MTDDAFQHAQGAEHPEDAEYAPTEPAESAEPTEPTEPESPAEPAVPPGPPTRTLALVALGLGILFLIADIVAIALAAGRFWPAATLIAQITLVATGVSFGLGLIAAVLNRGRWIGVAAMVLSVFANPWILLQLFGFLGGS